jgi:hypothetical protein
MALVPVPFRKFAVLECCYNCLYEVKCYDGVSSRGTKFVRSVLEVGSSVNCFKILSENTRTNAHTHTKTQISSESH